MPSPAKISIRPAVPDDALCLGVLATQVFLDTYATNGVNTDLANEALQRYSQSVFQARLSSSEIEITVAVCRHNLVGFLDLEMGGKCPIARVQGPEILRLYIQAPFQRAGIGRMLLQSAEVRAHNLGYPTIWLTAWAGNTGALAFYPRAGYEDVGITDYIINGRSYENRVFAKVLRSVA